jgi:hypothetical protein
MLQLTGCPLPAFSRTSAVLRNLIHGLSLFPCYVVTLSSLPASFNRAYTLWSLILLSYKSRHSITVAAVTLSLPSRTYTCHLSLSNYPLPLILSLFIFVLVLYIHVTNRSIQASQELGP